MGVLSRLSQRQQCRIGQKCFFLLRRISQRVLPYLTNWICIKMKIAYMVCCLLASSIALPAPQATNTATAQEKVAEEQQQNLNGVTEILKFGASLVEASLHLWDRRSPSSPSCF